MQRNLYRFYAWGHNLNPDLINMTHTVKHLSFGKHVPGRPSYVPRSLRRVWWGGAK